MLFAEMPSAPPTPSSRLAAALIAAPAWLMLAFALLVAFAAGPAGAQEESLERLRDDFRVIETRQGWALQPRQDTDDYGLIEIRDGDILIDGRQVDEEELRRYVDEAAAIIVAIAEQDAPRGDLRRGDAERQRREADKRRQSRDPQVSFGSSLRVERDEVVDEVVLLGGGLEVLGEVDGDATVILGPAHVEGSIDGNLTVIGGDVHLLSGSRVEGELVAVGGKVRRQSGARVDGEITQVAFGDIDVDGLDIDFGWPSWHVPDHGALDLVGHLVIAALLLGLIAAVQLVAPRKVRRVAERVRVEPWKAGAVGLAAQVLFPPLLLLVTILLLISIVGIPLLVVVVPALALLLVLYLFLGFAGVSRWCGEQMAARFDLRTPGPYALLAIGLLAIYGWSILGEIFAFTPWPIRFTAYLLIVLGFLVKYVAWTVGLGAAVLDQLAPLAVPAEPAWDRDREIADALPVRDLDPQ